MAEWAGKLVSGVLGDTGNGLRLFLSLKKVNRITFMMALTSMKMSCARGELRRLSLMAYSSFVYEQNSSSKFSFKRGDSHAAGGEKKSGKFKGVVWWWLVKVTGKSP